VIRVEKVLSQDPKSWVPPTRSICMTAQQCFHKSMYGEACKQPMEGKMVSREWHWEQAIKYAVESFKTALLLNGAAAIALMSFAAGTRKFSSALIYPLVSFAVGAMLPAVAFLAAYFGHLRYGSAMIAEDDRDFRILEGGELWNLLAIGLMLLSVLAFAVGIWLAAVALPKLELATG
jgi:uncharacterized membrane protein YidH (DUF202 family)